MSAINSTRGVALRIATCGMYAMMSLPGPASAESARERFSALQQVVDRLGAVGNHDADDVARLAKEPGESARLLIAALHPVADSESAAKSGDPSVEHVLWLIRALRYVTGGVNRCAVSDHRFSSSEEEQNRLYWLNLDRRKGCLAFFAMWPSRARIYIAPEDAQARIISQWRRWYAKSGKSFEYKPLEEPSPEQWLW